MASVQQAANQLAGVAAGALTTGAYLYSQTPTGRRQAETRQIEGDIARLQKMSPNKEDMTPVEALAAKERASQIEDLQRRLFTLNPTSANAEAFRQKQAEIKIAEKQVEGISGEIKEKEKEIEGWETPSIETKSRTGTPYLRRRSGYQKAIDALREEIARKKEERLGIQKLYGLKTEED